MAFGTQSFYNSGYPFKDPSVSLLPTGCPPYRLQVSVAPSLLSFCISELLTSPPNVPSAVWLFLNLALILYCLGVRLFTLKMKPEASTFCPSLWKYRHSLDTEVKQPMGLDSVWPITTPDTQGLET